VKPPTISPGARVLLNLLSAALVLRLLHLDDHSLWADEGVTWWNATHGSALDAATAESNHPPAWWLATRAWVARFGDSEASLRMPAAILGFVSVFLAWLLARRVLDPARVPSRGGFQGVDARAPLWVAGLAAVSAFWIEYAQEARMYAAVLAESLGLSLLYLRWLDRGGRWTLVAYALLAALAVHTHYFAVWPVVAHAAHAFLVARSTRGTASPVRILPLLAAQAAAGLLFVPWLVHMLGSYRGISPGVYEPFGRLAHALWRMGTGPALVVLDRARVEAGPTAVLAEEWPTVAATGLLWGVPIALGLKALARDRGLRAFVLASVLVPLALVLLAFPKFPLVHEKYLIYLAPFLLLLAVLGARSASGALRGMLLGGLVVLHAAGLVAYHFTEAEPVRRVLSSGHAYGKEQWREAHVFVARNASPDDVVLVHAPFLHETWDYYVAQRRGLAPASPLPPLDVESDRLLAPEEVLVRYPALADARRAVLATSHEATEGRDDWIRVLTEALGKAWGGFPNVKVETFPRQWGIRVVFFERR
jgi:hypothetical protein